MFVIRPINQKDHQGLMELIMDSGHGLTSLPKDEEVILNKIKLSERSFIHRSDRPSGELYLFVMEEIFTGKIVGVSGIISKIGGFEPYYFYRLNEEEYSSEMLKTKKNVRSLHLEAIHSGPAEICSLFLKKEFRNSQNGRFLSLSRFLFMANDRKYFEDKVIAEMRGVVNEEGVSPFYNAVGAHFLDIEFTKADYLSLKSKKFIDELIPKYPLIVDLLPEEAQKVVAKVHDQTAPAKRILEKEGFSFSGLVGVFEPGPVLKADLDEVRTIKESKVGIITDIAKDEFEGKTQILSRCGENFKASLGHIQEIPDDKNEQGVRIEAVTAAGLKLKLGDPVRYVTFRPE